MMRLTGKLTLVERPERPIPSKEVTAKTVYSVGGLMLTGGLLILTGIGYLIPTGTGIWPSHSWFVTLQFDHFVQLGSQKESFKPSHYGGMSNDGVHHCCVGGLNTSFSGSSIGSDSFIKLAHRIDLHLKARNIRAHWPTSGLWGFWLYHCCTVYHMWWTEEWRAFVWVGLFLLTTSCSLPSKDDASPVISAEQWSPL